MAKLQTFWDYILLVGKIFWDYILSEVSKWVSYNLLLNGVYKGYNPAY